MCGNEQCEVRAGQIQGDFLAAAKQDCSSCISNREWSSKICWNGRCGSIPWQIKAGCLVALKLECAKPGTNKELVSSDDAFDFAAREQYRSRVCGLRR